MTQGVTGTKSWLALAIALVMTMAGCGSSGSSAGTVAVSISPTSATVNIGKTQQFTATVKGTSNTGVTWQVQGTTGGGAVYGTVSTSGLYTAPATVPANQPVAVTAVSEADSTISATASVTVTIPITVAPATATVAAGATQQFSASVTFSSNTAVTWQVNGVNGGNSSTGTISTSGLYTAPSTFSGSSSVTVTAVAQADASKTASATVTITAPNLVITPATATLAAGGQQLFKATALSNPASANWSLQCDSTVAGACGSIASDGTYTAPLAPPPQGTVTVTATSSNGSANPSTATVTVQFGNATLSGAYVFVFPPAAPSFAGEAGVAAFDGAGGITGGTMDNGQDGGTAAAITGGSYSVGVDGRGTATLQTGAGAINWHFTVVNQKQGFALRDGGSGGQLRLQSAIAPLNGNYALQVSGTTFVVMGGLTADGAGNITAAVLDFAGSVAAANVSASGSSAAPSAEGRGTVTLNSAQGTQTYACYVADADHAVALEIDGANNSAGDLVREPAGPFAATSVSGRFAFALQGTNASSPYAAGGNFVADGGGSITSRSLDGVASSGFSSGGAYTVTSSTLGRITITWPSGSSGNSTYVLYPREQGGFAMIETDGSIGASGIALPVSGTFNTVQSLAGSFAMTSSGALANAAPEAWLGQLTLPSGSSFTGTLDLMDGGAVTADAAISGTLLPIDTASGLGLATLDSSSTVLGGAHWNLHMVDAQRVLVMENDGSRAVAGIIVKQY